MKRARDKAIAEIKSQFANRAPPAVVTPRLVKEVLGWQIIRAPTGCQGVFLEVSSPPLYPSTTLVIGNGNEYISFKTKDVGGKTSKPQLGKLHAVVETATGDERVFGQITLMMGSDAKTRSFTARLDERLKGALKTGDRLELATDRQRTSRITFPIRGLAAAFHEVQVCSRQ